VLGIGFLAAALSDVGGALWSLPVAFGLIGAPAIATLGSRSDLGVAAARRGVFAALPEVDAAARHMPPGVPSSGRALDSSLA
jgi:membrane glycosyltransferase